MTLNTLEADGFSTADLLPRSNFSSLVSENSEADTSAEPNDDSRLTGSKADSHSFHGSGCPLRTPNN